MEEIRLGIVGASTWSLDVARRAASAGDIVLFDEDDAALDAAHNALSGVPEVRVTGAIGDLHDRTMVLDATDRGLEAAARTSARLGVTCDPRALFATVVRDAPSAPVGIASGRSGRWVGLHPVALRADATLLEIVRAHATTPGTVRQWRRLLASIGLRSVVAPDQPGFLVEQVLFPALQVAHRLVESGAADAHELEAALRLGAGWESNPFDLLSAAGAGRVTGFDSGARPTVDQLFETSRNPMGSPTTAVSNTSSSTSTSAPTASRQA